MAGIEPRSQPWALGAHLLVWLTLTLFPVSLSGSGDVNVAQLAMHATLAAMIFGLILLGGVRTPAMIVGHGFIGALMLVSLALGYFAILSGVNAKSGALGDLLDVFRPLVYFAYFAFAFLVPLGERQLHRLLVFLFGLAALQLSFSMLVYLPAAWDFVNLYKGRPSDDSVLFHFFRWSGTHAYPSDFAFYLSFFFYFLFVARHRFFGAVTHFGLLTLICAGLLLTMSRGGLATIAVTAVIGAALFGRARLLLSLGVVAAILGAGVLMLDDRLDTEAINTNYVLDLIERGTEAESASHRIGELAMAVDFAQENFPFGFGAARDELYSRIRVIESLYGHYFIKWGLVGFLLFMVSVVYLLRAAWHIWRTSEDLVIRYFGGAFFLLTLSVPLVFGLSSAISDRFKGLPFYYLLAGYIACLYAARTARTLRAQKELTAATAIARL